MGPKAATKAVPVEPEPVRIPQPFDPDVVQARRDKIRDMLTRRQGTGSTDLAGSTPNPTFQRTLLG